MSLSAAVIDALVAAGATVEQLAAAVKADLAEREARAADRRAKDSERQRKSRASRNVTVTPRDAPPNEYISNPPRDESSEAKASSVAVDECQTVFADWNAMATATGLSTITKLTPKRRKACRSILRSDGLDAIQRAIERIPKSPFLRGETGNWAGRGADFEFLMRPDTVTKINEGKYDGRQSTSIPELQRPDPLRAALADAIAECEAEERAYPASDQADYPGPFAAISAH